MSQTISAEELLYLIAFSKVKNISDTDKKEQLIHFNSAKTIYEYCKEQQHLRKII